MSQGVFEFESSISDTKPIDINTTRYDIPVTIINNSSIGFSKADVAIKDNGTGEVQTVYFGRIEPNRRDTRVASMPGGVEQAAYNIWPDVGEKIFSMGFADNASAVNITIRD